MRVAIDCNDLGRRVTVRRRLSVGGFTDVVGILEGCTEHTFVVRDRNNKVHRLVRSEVAAAKVVQAPRPR